MEIVLVVLAAYLIGSVDFGVIVPRALGIDIYQHGSGNPGTSNVFRTLGKRAATMVLLGDATKGFIAAMLGDLLVSEPVGFACGTAAVVGHAFPIWHQLRGGRGVATAIGALIWLEPIVGVLLAVGWAAVVVTTKVASIASLGAMALYVPGAALTGHRGWSLVWAAATAGIVVGRHAPNIRRMMNRTERKIQA